MIATAERGVRRCPRSGGSVIGRSAVSWTGALAGQPGCGPACGHRVPAVRKRAQIGSAGDRRAGPGLVLRSCPSNSRPRSPASPPPGRAIMPRPSPCPGPDHASRSVCCRLPARRLRAGHAVPGPMAPHRSPWAVACATAVFSLRGTRLARRRVRCRPRGAPGGSCPRRRLARRGCADANSIELRCDRRDGPCGDRVDPGNGAVPTRLHIGSRSCPEAFRPPFALLAAHRPPERAGQGAGPVAWSIATHHRIRDGAGCRHPSRQFKWPPPCSLGPIVLQ